MDQLSYDVTVSTDIADHMNRVADDLSRDDAQPKMSEVRWALREGAITVHRLRDALSAAKAALAKARGEQQS